MSTDELALQPLEHAAHLIASKQISALELTDALLARIELLNPSLNAYITITADSARADASVADREIAQGNKRGVLQGIPVAHKDLFNTKGVRTTAGSKMLADHV